MNYYHRMINSFATIVICRVIIIMSIISIMVMISSPSYMTTMLTTIISLIPYYYS